MWPMVYQPAPGRSVVDCRSGHRHLNEKGMIVAYFAATGLGRKFSRAQTSLGPVSVAPKKIRRPSR